MFDADFFDDPYPMYARLRAAGPVHRIQPSNSGFPAWLVVGYEAARSALADQRLSKDTRRFQHVFGRSPRRRDIAPEVSATMLATDPPDHTRLRRLVAKAFTPAAVDRLRPRIHDITDRLLDALAPHGAADLVETFAVPLPVTVICELLGVPDADRVELRYWSNALFTAGRPNVRDEASHRIAGHMADLIAAKRADPGDDLLSALVAAHAGEDRLTEHELVSLATLLLVAGHETTTNLLGNAVHALLRHPDQLALLRDDPALLPAAVEEVLRYDAPLGITTIRFTAEPVQFDDTVIPADEAVMVSLAAANRDPRRFPDPDVFDVDRRANGHLAFGRGIHSCLGARLALAEANIALPALLTRLPGMRLEPHAGQPQWRHSRLMRGLETLPVRW